MTRSHKMSVASIAALSLPMLGAGVAAGQQIMSDPTPSTAEPAALRSSTAKVAAAAQQSIDTAQTEVVALVAETLSASFSEIPVEGDHGCFAEKFASIYRSTSANRF